MTVTLDAQRSTLDARRGMPVSLHHVWCDRAFCAVGGLIPSRFSVQMQSISIRSKCVYARHTPDATQHTHIDNRRGGEVGYEYCAWCSVCSVPAITHTFLAKGGGVAFVEVKASVIERTARASHNTHTDNKRGWAVFTWLAPPLPSVASKSHSAKYMSVWLLCLFVREFESYQFV